MCAGYAQQPWGFSVTASASIEEVKAELPFLLDIAKSSALVAARLTISVVRGPPQQKAEKDVRVFVCVWFGFFRVFMCFVVQVNKYITSELLSEGAEYDETTDAAEKEKETQDNPWLNVSLLPAAVGSAAGSASPAQVCLLFASFLVCVALV